MPELKGDIPNLRLFVSIKCILWLLTHSHCLRCKNNTLRMSRANGNSIPFIKASRRYLSLSFSQSDLRGDVYPALSLVLSLNSGLAFSSLFVQVDKARKRVWGRGVRGNGGLWGCSLCTVIQLFPLIHYQRFHLDRVSVSD